MQDKASIPPRGTVRLELDGPIFAGVEDWRRSQPEIPSRSKAVRLLLTLALSAHPNGSRPRIPTTPSRVTTHSTQKFEIMPATSPT
jgi:hypothetical protein